MNDLHFTHRFASGRVVKLDIRRALGQPPRFVAGSCRNLTPDEAFEYHEWVGTVCEEAMSVFTDEERDACAARGMALLHSGGKP